MDERDSWEQCARLRVLEETKERWISLGMIREEDAHLLQSVNGPYHPNIERSREEYFTKKRQEDQRILEKKAREYFNDEWVMEKEKELRELQKKGCGERPASEACTPLHDGSDCQSPQVEISEGRSFRSCKTGTVGAEEKGCGNAVGIPFSSATH